VDVAAWRCARLRHAGFDDDLARRISGQWAVDLHVLIGLVERGCPPRLAARILAPFEHERRQF
jgi:hypothetical protein